MSIAIEHVGPEAAARRRRAPFTSALILAGTLGVLPAVAAALGWPFGPVPRTGPALYQAHCGGCHALDLKKYGPMHRDVVGRTAATQPGYHYSAALRRSGIVWTEPVLDAWITDPRRLVPGTRMDARLDDPEARRLIIAYLKGAAATADGGR